jgi:hypothetical protein
MSLDQPCFCRWRGLDKTGVDGQLQAKAVINFGVTGTIITGANDNGLITTGVEDHTRGEASATSVL